MSPGVTIAIGVAAGVIVGGVVAFLVLRGGDSSSRVLAELSRLVSQQLQATQGAVTERLDASGRVVQDVRERLGQLTEATRRLEAMGASVSELKDLLQVPQLRGTLGEVWLEELLRQVFPSGLYEMQYGYRSGVRVDAVLRVGDRLVPIDAKFPLEACQRMIAAQGAEAERERRAFTKTLKARIDEIADKYIRPDEGTFDFALMYVPAERVYYEAVVGDNQSNDGESVVAYALGRRVIPVSPHTFYAYLASVLHGLKGLEVERRAQEILRTIGGLVQDVEQFSKAHELVGKHLENALRQYEETDRLAFKVREGLSGVARPTVTGGPPDAPPSRA